MDLSVAQDLFLAIRNDDYHNFDVIISRYHCSDLCYGRFPVLSLCYLFNAKKIIKQYESHLLEVNKYIKIPENAIIYPLFRKAAGRCLRLYLGDCIVSPLEMLLILGENSRLKRVYPHAFKNQRIIENLQAIQRIKTSEEIVASETIINVSRARLTESTKKIISFALVACVLMMFMSGGLIGATYLIGVGTNDSPILIYSESQFVKAMELGYCMELKSDITISESYESFSGVIKGNGFTITIKPGTTFIKTLEGRISNVCFEVNGDIEVNEDYAVITNNNNGVIEDVIVTANIKVTLGNATVQQTNIVNDKRLAVNIIANENNGTIENVIVNGESDIVGIAGSNDTTVLKYAAIAGENFGFIINSKNESNIKGTLCDLAGIVLYNFGTANNVLNTGSILSYYSEDPYRRLFVGGVTIFNFGIITNSSNSGAVTAQNDNENSYVQENLFTGVSTNCVFNIGGVAVVNYGNIETTKNTGNIEIDYYLGFIYIGGLVSNNESSNVYNNTVKKGIINNCGFEGKIIVNQKSEGTSLTYVGGIVGYNSCQVNNCFAIIDLESNVTLYWPVCGITPSMVYSNTSLVKENNSNNYYHYVENIITSGFVLQTGYGNYMVESLEDCVEYKTSIEEMKALEMYF